MKGVEELRRALAKFLRDNGLEAVEAWNGERRPKPGKAVAAVSLRGLESGGAGFQNYLGERYDEDSGQWEERYGKRVELTFGLDLYAATAREVQAGLDTLREALDQKGPAGMTALEFSAGETVYESDARRYMCPAKAKFSAWAVAAVREDGTFLDFEVKGETSE